jgi:coenzyme F420 hydrogenase subunit beta
MTAEKVEGQGLLVEKVINQGICVRCGACVGLCPYFNYFNGSVVVMDPCYSDTWRCYQLCPRGDYEGTALTQEAKSHEAQAIGSVTQVLMARTAEAEIRQTAQYGGVVTTLLIDALDKGQIRSAVLTDAGGRFSPAGRIARNRAEVLSCAGSRYSGSGSLAVLNRAMKEGEEQIGGVGLPCQMEALARMRKMEPDGAEQHGKISLKIGLFCTWALDYRRLRVFMETQGLEGAVLKYDIPPPPAEKFMVKTESGWIEFPLSDVRPLVQKGCALCQDMTAEWADLSVGTVEGAEGWNTVLVRSERGEKLIQEEIAAGRLEIQELPEANLEHLKEAARNKRERARQAALERERPGKEG